MEPCGSITVNERGIVDGNPLVIHPHPNFRIFLTVNPHYGEVSRATKTKKEKAQKHLKPNFPPKEPIPKESPIDP